MEFVPKQKMHRSVLMIAVMTDVKKERFLLVMVPPVSPIRQVMMSVMRISIARFMKTTTGLVARKAR